MPGIIVGVDGSEPSRRALGWAMREAARHDFPLTVLTVHRASVRPATEVYWPMLDLPDGARVDEASVRKAAQEMVNAAAAEMGQPAPDVTVNVTDGNPAEELVRASRDADMLVVGSHGSGGFASLLLGSVSSQVVHHAGCPVVVVREPH
jgi:nucleotide-binding universal stress UspA family protein